MKIPSFLYNLKPLNAQQKFLFAHNSLLYINEAETGKLKLLAKQNKITIEEKTTRYSIFQNTKYIYFELKKIIEEEAFIENINNSIKTNAQKQILTKIDDRQETFLKIFDNIYGFSEIKKALLLAYFNPDYSIALLCQDKDVYNNFHNIISSLNISIIDKWNKSIEEELKEREDKPMVFMSLLKQGLSKELTKYANSGLDDYFDIVFVLEKYKKEDFEKIAQMFLENEKSKENKEDFKFLEFAKNNKNQIDLKNLFNNKKHIETIKSFVSEMKENEDKYYFNVSVNIIDTIKQILIAQIILGNKDRMTEKEIWNAIEIVSFSNFKKIQ